MSKDIEFRTMDDSAELAAVAGEVDENDNIVQMGILKNVGTEVITSIRLRVVNEPGLPATLAASVNGIALTDTEQELLSGPLAPGESVGAILTWSTPSTVNEGEDSGYITGSAG